MSDPLSLLREYHIAKKPMNHDEHFIYLGELRFPRNTVTAYKQDRGRGDPYTLDALYFLLQKPLLAGAAKTRAYNDESIKYGFSKVLLADQKDVLAYLQGKTETSQYLISIDELAALSAPTPQDSQAKVSEKAGEKRAREEPKLDLLDEQLLEAKRHLVEHLSQRPLRVPEPGKAASDARVITTLESIEIEQPCVPYIEADKAVTRAIIEKERACATNQIVRQNYLLSKGGREFSHLISLVRNALSGGPSSSQSKSHAKPASGTSSSQPTRYQIEEETALRAAGMDSVVYQITQTQGLLSTVNAEPAASKNSTGDRPDGNRSERSGKLSTPIILVPQAPSALINILNVKDLLEKGVFKTREEKKAENAKKEERITIVHEEGGHNYHYKVVDNPKEIPPDQWDRVIAVFVQGPEWQFRDYNLASYRPCNAEGKVIDPQRPGTVVNMLAKVCGFHLVYSKEPLHENIPKWKVKTLAIERNKRHQDHRVMNTFWDELKSQGKLMSQQKAKMNPPARA